MDERSAQILEALFLSRLEPQALRFSASSRAAAKRVVTAIGRIDGSSTTRLAGYVNRNAFLYGCLAFTNQLPEEHLLVGYGVRHSSTTKIQALDHVIGNAGSVDIPLRVAQAVSRHYAADERNEVILFHNHPRWWMNWLFDNRPIASHADRIALEDMALTRHQLFRTLSRKGRILFYLGENGFVQQFRIPTVPFLMDKISRAVPLQ